MVFNKFNSIENSYQSEFIKKIYDSGFDKEKYVVQEKVHGANFSFITNGKDVTTAKRTGLIEESENFYNSKIVQEKYKTKIKSLFNSISKERNIETLTVFGEFLEEDILIKS